MITSDLQLPDAEVFPTPQAALDILEDEMDAEDELFVLGGARLFEYFIDKAQWIYLTHISKTYE